MVGQLEPPAQAPVQQDGRISQPWLAQQQALAAAVEQARPQVGDFLTTARPDPGTAWLRCDGRAVPRAAYPALFAVLGSTYGDGDGTTTFGLPVVTVVGGAVWVRGVA